MSRRLAAEEPRDRDKYLAPLLSAYRDAPQASTGYSPFELIYGHKVRGPLTIMKEYWSSVDPPADDDVTTHQYLTEMRHRLKETCKVARDHLQNTQEKSIKYANRHARMRTLQPEDHVLIFLADSLKKLLMSWRGPYVVLERIGRYNYVLDIDGVRQAHHINLLRKYFCRSAVNGDSTTPQAEPQAAAALAAAPSDFPEDTPIALNIVEPIYVNTTVAIEDPQDDALDDSEPAIPAPKGETLADCHISNELDRQQRDGLLAILEEHQETFTDVASLTPTLEHVIILKDPGNLRLQHSYPLPYSLETQLRENLQEWQRMGIIAPSQSPYCSPLLAVRKKDSTHRFCLDCRYLNNQTQYDAEPISDIAAIFSRLSGKKFSKIDLTSGYWQVPLEPSSHPYTAFRTRSGLLEFLVMTFGLANAPATFSHCVRQVTEGISNVEVYMDDLLIATTTWEEHCDALQQLHAAGTGEASPSGEAFQVRVWMFQSPISGAPAQSRLLPTSAG